MDVHYHPHAGKKGFKDYLSEGLMIFVAVTMGFFAESLRERMYNREREKEYISSLTKNLEQDEISLINTINNNQKKISGLDSLLSLSSKKTSNPTTIGLLYTYSQRYASYYSGFSSNDATMMQLKNSGGLHYIKDHHIADSIAAYDVMVRNIYASEGAYGNAISKTIDVMSELLILKYRYDTTRFINGVYKRSDISLLTDDKKKMDIFYNKIFIQREWTRNYVNNLKGMLPPLKRLVELLKKK